MAARKRKANGVSYAALMVDTADIETLDIAELGRPLIVRPISAGEMDRLLRAYRDPDADDDDPRAIDSEGFDLAYLAACVREKDGSRLIPEGKERDLLNFKSGILTRIRQAVAKVNGMGGQAGN